MASGAEGPDDAAGWAITDSAMEVARENLRRVRLRRTAKTLASTGASPEQVAAELEIDVAQVKRLLSVASRAENASRAEELIWIAAVEGTDRAELVRTLGALTYSTWQPAPPPHDGGVLGSWDQVRVAHMLGLLSPAEFRAIRAAASFDAG